MNTTGKERQTAVVTGASSGIGLGITVDALFYLQSAQMVKGENLRIDGGAHAGAKW
jgi:NADP-dependent 3-hydroxy acid dehydrogenase YdfG